MARWYAEKVRLLPLLLSLAFVTAACFNGPTPEAEGPAPAGSGREVLRREYAVDQRVTLRETAQVPDPVSGGSKLYVRFRNLGDASSGEFHPASLLVGAGALGEVQLPTDGGVRRLYLHPDGSLQSEAPTEPATEMAIPAVDAGALAFSTETETLVLSGTYRFELDVNAPSGATSIEVTVAAE